MKVTGKWPANGATIKMLGNWAAGQLDNWATGRGNPKGCSFN